jgi:hypothetical protein
MSGETVQFDQAAERAKSESEKRTVSTISFPYLDLDAAVEVAQAMYKTRGHGAMEAADLAATLNQTISGNFRLKTGTARIFGLTEKEGRDLTKLSDLGICIIEESTEAEARAAAFMHVPLYSAIYEKYKGQRLPPPKALEREMQGLGVSGKQTNKARQAFERSARQAGFFAKGEDRLVKPHFNGQAPEREARDDSSRKEEGGNSGGGGSASGSGSGGRGGDYHPFVEGLLQTMPEPGTLWAIEGRAAWLEAAANVFKLMYQGDGKIAVSAQLEKNTATDQ